MSEQYNSASKGCKPGWPDLQLFAVEDSHNWFLMADGLGIDVAPSQLFNLKTLSYKFFVAKYVEPSRPNIKGRDFPCGVSRDEWRPRIQALLRNHATIRAETTVVPA